MKAAVRILVLLAASATAVWFINRSAGDAGSKGTRPTGPQLVASTQRSMGAEARFTAWTSDAKAARAAFNDAFRELERLESLMSVWRPDSDIVKLNAAAGTQPVYRSYNNRFSPDPAQNDGNHRITPSYGDHLRQTRFLGYNDEGIAFCTPAATGPGADLQATDPLKFQDTKKYKDRLADAQKATDETEAMVVMRGQLMCLPLVVAAFEFGFIGGSMGSVVGEKFSMGVQRCLDDGVPLVCFAASGGARMQESLFSLMQMAKTSAALARLDDAKQMFISLLADPTTGGVTASFAMLGDFILAEPKALIGFAGPRTIWNTIKVELPEGFQRSEFLQEHGFVDFVVHRKDLRSEIARLVDFCAK